MLGGLLLEGQVVEAVELDAEVLGEAIARLVGLGEEDVGVEIEEARLRVDLRGHMRSHRACFLERAGDVMALAESLEHPLDRLRGRSALELIRYRFGICDLRRICHRVHIAHSPSPLSTL